MTARIRVGLAIALLAAVAAWLFGIIGPPATPPGSELILPPSSDRGNADENVNVLILGTSLSANGDWTGSLAENFGTCENRVITVEVLARAGASSRWGLKALQERLEASSLPGPDVIIAEFSVNDAAVFRGVPLALSARYHREMVGLAGKSGAQVLLATMSPAWGWNAWERPGQKRYQSLYRDLSTASDAGLIDTIGAWRALTDDERTELVPDGLHPSDDAMKSIAVPMIITALRRVICRN